MPSAFPGAGPEIDRRAIGIALLFQAMVAGVVAGAGLPLLTLVALPVIGGVTVGLLSRNFDEEYFDGAVAAGLAPVLAPVVGLSVTWVTNPAVSARIVASIGSIIFSVALPVVLVGTTVSAGVGAVISYQTASIRRQAKAGVELQ